MAKGNLRKQKYIFVKTLKKNENSPSILKWISLSICSLLICLRKPSSMQAHIYFQCFSGFPAESNFEEKSFSIRLIPFSIRSKFLFLCWGKSLTMFNHYKMLNVSNDTNKIPYSSSQICWFLDYCIGSWNQFCPTVELMKDWPYI